VECFRKARLAVGDHRIRVLPENQADAKGKNLRFPALMQTNSVQLDVGHPAGL
jgi:hypothetical protein